jgi:hypothetical protein
MAKKLNTYVHAVEKDDKGEVTNQGVFGPDDDLAKPENAWVEKAITNPDVWDNGDSESDEPAGSRDAAPKPAPRTPAVKPPTK